MLNLSAIRPGGRWRLRPGPMVWLIGALVAGTSLATPFMVMVLSKGMESMTGVAADRWPVASKYGIAVTLLVFAVLGMAYSRRNLSVGFLLFNGALFHLGALADSKPVLVVSLLVAMCASPSWMLQIGLALDQGAAQSEARKDTAAVYSWSGVFAALIILTQIYAVILGDAEGPLMDAAMVTVMLLHGGLCVGAAIFILLALTGEVEGRVPAKLSWALWAVQMKTWLDPHARALYVGSGLVGAMLALTEWYTVLHALDDLLLALAWAAVIFTVSSALGVVATLFIDKLCANHPRLILFGGGLILLGAFLTGFASLVPESKTTQIAMTGVAATMSEIGSTVLGVVFTIMLYRTLDPRNDARRSMANVVKFSAQGTVLLVAAYVWKLAGYPGVLALGAALAVAFLLLVRWALALRFEAAVRLVPGLVVGLRVGSGDKAGALGLMMPDATMEAVGHGRLAVGGGALQIWEPRATATWRRWLMMLVGPPALVPHAIAGPKTYRVAVGAGRFVHLRLGRGVTARLTEMNGEIHLHSLRRRGLELLTDITLRRPFAPDKQLPGWVTSPLATLWRLVRPSELPSTDGTGGRRAALLATVGVIGTLYAAASAVDARGTTASAIWAAVALLVLAWASAWAIGARRRSVRTTPRRTARVQLGWAILLSLGALTTAAVGVAQIHSAPTIVAGVLVMVVALVVGLPATRRVRSTWHTLETIAVLDGAI